ncbi:CU044_5270 family protein [Streptomyces longwoodensis]|uniref:CU044_5270 family protein n=1 Tax=Streptomyces longwoodensis TaxID=68231 RepID=UPI002E80AB8C|nr:CU044_5270 family protein [Streptomyces longwoodensis]WUC57313.1 CU044_5270 family protein [Streptomyces longwoodensis]
MPDELDLLRHANPVPDDGPHYADGALDHRTELRLDRLLHQAPTTTDVQPRLLRRTRVAAPPRLMGALAATGVVLIVVLTALLGGPDPQSAVAAPRPLVVQDGSPPVPLALLADRARAAAEGGSPVLRKGTHVQSWSMSMSDQAPPVTLPQETVVRWRPDGSHTELVVATDPRHPGRPVVGDEGEAGLPQLVADGHVISRRDYPPSWSDAPPEAPPPHDAARLRTYLRQAAYLPSTMNTDEVLDATEILLDHWTLGARESAVLARLLAETPGLRPVGRVTDRLGRTGQAYVHLGSQGARRMLIMDPSTGAVLGMEMTATRAEPRFRLKPGDVMQYSAWLR